MRHPLAGAKLLERIQAARPFMEGLEALAEMAFITDAEGTIIYANRATERVSGFSLEEIIGKNPGDLWGGQMPEAFYADFWKRIKEEKAPFTAEMHNRRKDGTMHWQEMFVTPILSEDGGIRFFIALEPDITDRKEREKFREEFVSILGHQLKNPLTAINWTIELLLERNGLRPDQKTALKDAYEGSRSMAELVEDLLIISRLGQAPPQEDDVDLARELADLVALAKKRHPNADVAIDLSPGAALKTNRTLLLQVLSNLLSNAFEYADRRKPRVRVALSADGAQLRLEIENNGLAIEPAAQEKIFTRFFRTDAAIAYKSGGSGLGLFIVKMICDAFGWKVRFKSPNAGGSGTTFFMEIPRR